MTDLRGTDPTTSPSLRLHVYKDGVLVETELCDDEDDAAVAASRWVESPGVVCVVASIGEDDGCDVDGVGDAPDTALSDAYPHLP